MMTSVLNLCPRGKRQEIGRLVSSRQYVSAPRRISPIKKKKNVGKVTNDEFSRGFRKENKTRSVADAEKADRTAYDMTHGIAAEPKHQKCRV